MKKVSTLTISKLLRKGCATTLAIVLLPHPWTTSAVAQQRNEWVGTGMQAMQQVSGAIQGAMSQSQIIDLSPSAIRNVPAANIPVPLNRCVIPQANIAMPRYCEADGNPAEFTSVPDLNMSMSFRAYAQTKEFADKQSFDLERMLDKGKNEFANGAITGVQCLNDAKKKEATRRQGILNAIQARIDEVKERNAKFKEQVKLVELQMNKIKGELHGSADGQSRHIVDNVNPPIKNLPANCQAILETNRDVNPNGIGLLGIRDGALKPVARNGGNFLANQQTFKDDLARFVASSNAHIQKHGIESFRETGLALFKGNPELRKRISESLAPFTSRVASEESKIRSELKAVGYDAPALDKNFTSDFDNFKADSKEFFRKKFVSQCVTNARDGLTLDPEVILNSLRQESTNNQGTTIINYRAALKNILLSDSFIEDKIELMKKLDQSYGEGNITLTLANSSAKQETKPAYVYFQQAIEACKVEYSDDKTFTATQEAGRSEAVKVQRAEAYLNDLKKLHDTFLADMTKEVTDEILNCNSRPVQAGSCTLEGKAFNVAGADFCFKTAESCATQINSCYKAADALVIKKTAELNQNADKFNGLVEGLFADQKRFLNEFKSSVMGEAGLLNALIPGADFVYPKDLLVDVPELKLDPATNTYIRGGNAESIGQSLNALTVKMESLKKALADQGQKADTELGRYIVDQENNMRKNAEKFKKVASDCDRRMSAAESIVANYNQERARAEAEARASAGDFCRRFYDLSTNPTAGCGDPVEDAYETANKAVQFITPSSRAYVNQYRNLCAQTQSEREGGSEEDAARPNAASEIANACRQGGAWDSVVSEYIKDYVDNLESRHDLSESEYKAIEDYVSNRGDSFSNANAFLESKMKDLKDVRGLATSIDNMKRFVTGNGQARETSEEDFLNTNAPLDLGMDAQYTGPAAVDEEMQAAKNAFDSFTNAAPNSAEKINAYSTFVARYKSIDPKYQRHFSGNIPDTFDAAAKIKQLNATKSARDALKAIAANAPAGTESGKKAFTPCDMIAANVWRQAVSQCSDSSDSACAQDKADELFASGSTVNRQIASLNLTSATDSSIAREFSEIGEKNNIVCDALAQNRRGGMGSLEAFDREILGESYDDIMSGR